MCLIYLIYFQWWIKYISLNDTHSPINDHNIVTHCLYCTGMVLFLYWCLLLGCCCLCGGGGHYDQTDIENRLCVGTESVVSSHTPVTPGHLLHLEHVILDISDHLPCVLSQQWFICLLSQIHRRISLKSFTCRGNTCTHVIVMWSWWWWYVNDQTVIDVLLWKSCFVLKFYNLFFLFWLYFEVYRLSLCEAQPRAVYHGSRLHWGPREWRLQTQQAHQESWESERLRWPRC